MDRNSIEYKKNYKEFEKYSEFITLSMLIVRDYTPNKGTYHINTQNNLARSGGGGGGIDPVLEQNISVTNFSSTKSYACYGAWQDLAANCSNQYCIGCQSYIAGDGGQNCDCACVFGDYICSCTARGNPCTY